MEATIFTGWIYDHLKPHAAGVKVAHPLMLRAIAASKKKNDRIDAGKLADCLRWQGLSRNPVKQVSVDLGAYWLHQITSEAVASRGTCKTPKPGSSPSAAAASKISDLARLINSVDVKS